MTCEKLKIIFRIQDKMEHGRHSVEFSNSFLYRNQIALKKCLTYILDNPDEEPENKETQEARRAAMRNFFRSISSHAFDRSEDLPRLEQLYEHLGGWQGIRNKPLYLWNTRFLFCVFLSRSVIF